MKLSDDIFRFFQKQRFVIVSTICRRTGKPHNSCKGIVHMTKDGVIYLMDLYRWQTFANLKENSNISITAVDEHRFRGWSLKGRAKIIAGSKLKQDIIRAWDTRLTARITHRVIKNMEDVKGHGRHPEAQLPRPEYMIVMTVDEIVDLVPRHVKEKGGA